MIKIIDCIGFVDILVKKVMVNQARNLEGNSKHNLKMLWIQKSTCKFDEEYNRNIHVIDGSFVICNNKNILFDMYFFFFLLAGEIILNES